MHKRNKIMDINATLTAEFSLKPQHTDNIIALIDEGCTIPFIARYRKEMTGSCDDQVLREFYDRLTYLRSLNKRKEEITKIITEQGNMTDELAKSIDDAVTLTEVEDIYRPYKPKRKTRASEAIAKGLKPLAEAILSGEIDGDVNSLAETFITEENGLKSAEEAIQGAKDIIAEMISDSAEVRKDLREMMEKTAEIKTSLVEDQEKSKTYEMYKDFSETIAKIPSHRILAINRGENDECLKVKIEVNRTDVSSIAFPSRNFEILI